MLQNDTVMDKRLWLMALIKTLVKRDKQSYFSYENLMGNFKDGEIGTKIRN